MSIESTLERIAKALETIAVELGSISEMPDDDTPAKEEKPAKKPPAKDKQTKVGSDDDQVDVTKEEVRAKLQAVQKATTPAQAKSILKGHGASTIGNLAVSKYPLVIADCDKILDDA